MSIGKAFFVAAPVMAALAVGAQAGDTGGPVNAFGLDHTPLGQATLAGAEAGHGGTLTISNIGSSGKDGVSIDLGESEGLIGEVDFGPAGALRPGMHFWIDAFIPAPVPAGQDQKVMCAQFQEVQGGLLACALDQTQVPPMGVLHLEALLDGQPVQTFEWEPTQIPQPLFVSNIGSSGKDGVRLTVSNIGSSGKDGVGGANFDVFFEINVPILATVQVPGAAPFQADEVRLHYNLPPLPPGPPIIFADLRAANPMPPFQFEILHEALLKFNVPNQNLGQAQMQAGHDHLTISNIGSSGKDGVRQDPIPCAIGLRADIPLPSIRDSFFDITVFHTDPVGLLPLRNSVVQPPQGPVQLFVEFPPQVPSITVEAQLGGTPVLVLPGQPVPFTAAADAPPSTFVYDAYDRLLAWDTPTNVLIDNNLVLTDALTLQVEGPASLGGTEILSMELSGGGLLSEFTIANLQILGPPSSCPWDCGDPMDGVVDTIDFLALLAQWGQTGTSCDFDGNGTDTVDFLALLAAWGPCP